MEVPQPADSEGSSQIGTPKRKRKPHAATNQQSSKRPKTDFDTDEFKTEEPSTPRRSARLLAKRSLKESSHLLPAENSSKLSGGSARKKQPSVSAAAVTEEGETPSLGPRRQSSRLHQGEKNNRGEQSTSELSATEGTAKTESLRGRKKSPSKRTATVRKTSVSGARALSPQKKGTKETVDASEPDRTSRSGRKGKRSSSTTLLSTSPPPKRQKSISKVSPRAARKKQESDIDSQPSSSRGTQRGKDSQTGHSKARKTRQVAESTDSEPESSKTRKGKSPAKLKNSPLLTAQEKLEEKAGAKGKSRASSSKGKGRADSAATAKRRSEEGGGFSYSLPSFAEFARLTMASEGSGDSPFPPDPHSGTGSGNEGPSSSGGGATSNNPPGSEEEPKSLDPFAAMGEENRRLQMMLEARGLPPHLLGALGSKMHYMLQKSMTSSLSSSNNSRAQQLLAGIESTEDETVQLQSCIELGQLLVMGNEDTLSGFPVKQAVPSLINLLSMEHNFDMMLNACRALTYMMEALPRSTVVVADAIPILIEKLQVIQCMDVAEQALSSLELLSKRHGKAILQSGGLNACLLYLDFFSIVPQRCALSVAANCCHSVTEEDFPMVSSAIPILTNKLQHQDKRSVESCCLCFSRLVIDNFYGNPKLLQEIAAHGLLPNLQQLLVISPPVISMNTFVMVLKILSTLCSTCPALAVELLRLNMADTLRYLLVGSGEITLENIELMSRSPSEVYEILSLASEMMPPLPKDGIFEVEEMLAMRRHSPTTVQWQWQDGDGVWKPYSRIENRIIEATHQAHEDECSIEVMGRAYVVDLASMQQINEDSGTSRAVRRSIINPVKTTSKEGKEEKAEEDARALALTADPSLGSRFVQTLFGALYEVFNSMAGPSVRNKCLKTILRILYHSDADVLSAILKDISVSSLIATMLKAQDYQVVVGAMQMAAVLMQKLPDIFVIYFHREGVMHQMKTLRDVPLKMLATPKQEITTPPTTHSSTTSTAAAESSQTPTSTRKRLSDIFRKGRRHFRRTLTRGRSDDQDPRSQIPPLPPHASSTQPAEGKPPSTPPPPSAVVWLVGGRANSGVTNTPSTSGSKASTSEASKPTGEEGGSVTAQVTLTPSAIATGGSGNVKERIQRWIQQQATQFLERWSGMSNQNPALEVVNQLSEAAQQLDLQLSSCASALTKICDILSDPVSNVSAFEFMYCKVHIKLRSFLMVDGAECAMPFNTRLRQFLHIFMGLPEQGSSLATWSPPMQVGLVPLLHQLHGCVNQLEQLPVKVHDLPGRRGSQALRFLHKNQIKCTLERHSSAVHTSQWKGGPLRIDPLATIQTLERYMMIRGFGRPDYGRRFDDFDSEDSEVDESLLFGGIQSAGLERHHIEFLIGDQVLPYNMTIFQAIKQYALGGMLEGEEDMMPLGRPEIWIRSHTIHYRNIVPSDASGAGPSSSHVFSSSLPASPFSFHHSHRTPPLPTHTGPKSWSAGGQSSRRRAGSAKLPPTTPTVPPVRITRSHSNKEKLATPSLSISSPLLPPVPPVTPPTTSRRVAVAAAIKTSETSSRLRLPPLHQAIQQSMNLDLGVAISDDPSLPVIQLMKVLYALNNHWTDLYQGLAGNPIVPTAEFVNNKLTAKATRQLQDPLNVMTGNFPQWLQSLAKNCPFLFPFEFRQTLFYLTTFDRDRALARLQEQQPELSTGEASQMVTPRFDKKKRCVSRDNLLEQAEKLMNDLASNRAILEIHYEDEVGTGLGPTLEFYALVSRELQRSDLMLWRGDPCPMPGAAQGASSTPLYAYSPVGLFPCPLGPSTRFSIVEEVCSKFRFLGKFMAKAIMDSRMLDIPLSEAFYKWMLGLERTFTAQDLQYVDPVVARSFAQLAAVAVKKHALENDPLLTGKALAVGIDSLTLEGGGSIEDLDLDFTLPGYPDIELKPGGKEVPVTIHNLDEYLKLVVDWTLVRGVGRQMEAFKEGFNSVYPLSSLQGLICPGESPWGPILQILAQLLLFEQDQQMDMLICGAHHQKWDIKELMECCRPDHGYSHDSRAVQLLFEVLSTYDTTEQRQFVQFVTGSPRLPVGGFKALNPPLTIVRKTVDSPKRPDEFLPSVMTCVNYLKLPDYSTAEVLRERLKFALQEGKHSFHLS